MTPYKKLTFAEREEMSPPVERLTFSGQTFPARSEHQRHQDFP